MTTTCWRNKLHTALENRGESFVDVVATTLKEDELSTLFDDGFGGSEGPPFTLWTTNWVYFPCVYDGAEWVESVPRNPCDTKTEHVGGQ